jgi:hypothetical protein
MNQRVRRVFRYDDGHDDQKWHRHRENHSHLDDDDEGPSPFFTPNLYHEAGRPHLSSESASLV